MNFEPKFLLRADSGESKWGIDTRNTVGYAPRILQKRRPKEGRGEGGYGS